MITPIEDFCTLPAAAQPLRLMEFDELFRSQVRPPQQIDARHVEFTFAGAEGLHAKVSDLVARESTCWASPGFFAWSRATPLSRYAAARTGWLESASAVWAWPSAAFVSPLARYA